MGGIAGGRRGLAIARRAPAPQSTNKVGVGSADPNLVGSRGFPSLQPLDFFATSQSGKSQSASVSTFASSLDITEVQRGLYREAGRVHFSGGVRTPLCNELWGAVRRPSPDDEVLSLQAPELCMRCV